MISLLRIALVFVVCVLGSAVRAADEVAAATLTKVGQVAPDFSGMSLTGEPIKLSALRGKVVVLSFFATWCGPCKEELPHFEKTLWQGLREKGLVVLGVDREETEKLVAPFVKKLGLTFPVIADADRSIYARYATGYIPRTYLIGPDGKIVFQSVGNAQKEFDQLVALTKEQLEKSAGK
jgi:peroxiredoxin